MCSPSPAPAAEQKAVTELPEWAKPYGKDILAKGAALTDINQNPYQTYNQERLAGFSPMQQQAMQGAAAMQPSQQVAQGSGLAYGAGLGGLGMAAGATPQNFQSQVGGYMNPYLQMSLAPQLAEANRAYDIGATKQQSAATQAGAFGGSREAIMAAENERNRNMGLQSIIGQGYNTAYNQAQNQYNQAQQQALQGLGVGLQGASTLGQLGQTQYGQQMGINQLQAQYGGQQQAQMQKGLDTAYQDFLNQQNYPYKQLGFMSDLLRGTPTGSSSVTQMYQAPPSALQTAGALGLGAYGISKMADGGEVKTYAGNEDSVTSEDNVRRISRFLPAKQLPVSYQMAQQRNDLDAQLALQKQMAENASIQRGLGSAFNALPPETQDGVVRAAGGGILAFQDRGLVPSTDAEDEDERLTVEDRESLLGYTGTPTQQAMAKGLLSSQERLMNSPQYDPLTRKGRLSAQKRSFEELKEMAGPDPYGALEKTLTEDKETSAKVLEQNKGLAALQAIPAILQPGGTVRGFGAAAGAIGTGLGKAAEANRAEKRYISQMQFHLADAKRKENMGLYGEARKDVQDAEVARLNAVKEARAREAAVGTNFAKGVQALRAPAGAGGAGKGPKPDDIIVQKELQLSTMDPNDPKYSSLKKEVDALRAYQGRKAPGLPGTQLRVDATSFNEAQDRTNSRINRDFKYNELQRKGDMRGMETRKMQILQEELAKPPTDPSASPVTPPPTQSGAPKAGATITPAAFAEKWATLKKGQTLVGPDGLTYTKQ